MVRWISFAAFGVLFVGLAGFSALIVQRQAENKGVLTPAEPQLQMNALTFQLPSWEGGKQSKPLSEIILETPNLLISFYASWCVTCGQAMQKLTALKAENIEMLGIAWRDNEKKLAVFHAQHGQPFDEVLFDKKGIAGVYFGITGTPEYFFFQNGKLIRHFVGEMNVESVKALLGQS